MKEIKGYQYNGEVIVDLEGVSSYSQEGYQYGGGHITVRKTVAGQYILALDDGADTEYFLLEENDSLDAKDYREQMIHEDDEDLARIENITWGLVDADFYAVDDAFDGECKIIVERTWNSHTSWEFATGDNYEPIVFDSYADAKSWVDEQNAETYYLAHNEAGRPEYIITW